MCKRKLTREQEKDIRDKYLRGWLVEDLKQQYGFKTKKSIYDIVERNGGGKRSFSDTMDIKHPGRKMDFSIIDNPFKAYFIGLMLTDGWVHNKSIGLSMTDKDVIEFVCDQFQKKCSVIHKPGNRKVQYRFIINSERIVNDLKRFGIVERKSLTLQPPRLKKCEVKYLSFLMRGIIDGDGWIRKDGNEFFICSMSYDFISWCKRVFENHYRFIPLNLMQRQGDIWEIRTSDIRNMMLLYIHIYYTPYGMNRKYQKVVKRFREHNRRD